MGEQRVLPDGLVAIIRDDGNRLEIRDQTAELFSLDVPENGIFYAFSDDPRHGVCVVVAFDPPAMSSGWSDWSYRIDTASRSMERMGPWR